MAEVKLANKLENTLQCPICYDGYTSASHIPKVLSCMHTLCAPCVQKLSVADRSVTCPVCNARTPLPLGAGGLAALPINYLVRDLIEVIEQHKANTCLFHHQMLNLFCVDCNCTVCSECAAADAHQKHTIQDAEQVIVDRRRSLQARLDELKRQSSQLQELSQVLTRASSTIQEHRTSSERELFQFVSRLCQQMRDRTEVYKARVTTCAKAMEQKIAKTLEDTKRADNLAQTEINRLEKLLKKTTDTQIINLTDKQLKEHVIADQLQTFLTESQQESKTYSPHWQFASEESLFHSFVRSMRLVSEHDLHTSQPVVRVWYVNTTPSVAIEHHQPPRCLTLTNICALANPTWTDIRQSASEVVGKLSNPKAMLCAEVHRHQLCCVFAKAAEFDSLSMSQQMLWLFEVPMLLENRKQLVTQSLSKDSSRRTITEIPIFKLWISIQVVMMLGVMDSERENLRRSLCGWPCVIAVDDTKIQNYPTMELRALITDAVTPFLQGGWKSDEKDKDLYEVHLISKSLDKHVVAVDWSAKNIDLTQETKTNGFAFALVWKDKATYMARCWQPPYSEKSEHVQTS